MALISLIASKGSHESTGLTVLESARRSDIALPYSCKNVRCGACKCKVVSGETKELMPEHALTEAQKACGSILSCARSALTDLIVEAEDLTGYLLPEVRMQACRVASLKKFTAGVAPIRPDSWLPVDGSCG